MQSAVLELDERKETAGIGTHDDRVFNARRQFASAQPATVPSVLGTIVEQAVGLCRR